MLFEDRPTKTINLPIGVNFLQKIFKKFQNWSRKRFGNLKYSVIKICGNFE